MDTSLSLVGGASSSSIAMLLIRRRYDITRRLKHVISTLISRSWSKACSFDQSDISHTCQADNICLWTSAQSSNRMLLKCGRHEQTEKSSQHIDSLIVSNFILSINLKGVKQLSLNLERVTFLLHLLLYCPQPRPRPRPIVFHCYWF